VIVCGSCQEELDSNATPNDHDGVLFCDECYETVTAAGATWFVAHVDHCFVTGSSDEVLVPLSKPPLGRAAPSTLPLAKAVSRARRWLATADAVVIVAGAGMSRDSGLPDFRGRDGWYSMGEEGNDRKIAMDQVCYQSGSEHFDVSWQLARAMLRAFRSCEPHAGYAKLQEAFGGNGCFVLTSNIDGYFAEAGFDKKRLFETHGSAHRLQCASYKRDETEACAGAWPLPDADAEALLEAEAVPRCRTCHGVARPNVSHVTDEDEDVDASVTGPQRSRLLRWLKRHWRLDRKLVVLEVGTGISPHSLRFDSELLAARHGSKLIRIDPGEADVPDSKRCVGLKMGALEALTRLCAQEEPPAPKDAREAGAFDEAGLT